MLQLLVQCEHTNLYCLWFLRKILVLGSSWGRKPVEVWGLERAGGSFSGIKEQESAGPGGGRWDTLCWRHSGFVSQGSCECH